MNINRTLIDNSPDGYKMDEMLNKCLENECITNIDIATGFWDLRGTKLIYENLKKFLERGNTRFRLLIGKDPFLYRSDIETLNKAKSYKQQEDGLLVEMNDFEAKEEYIDVVQMLVDGLSTGDGKFEIRVYKPEGELKEQFLHAKCFILYGKETDDHNRTTDIAYGIIGSANLTKQGMQGNSELNVLETDANNIIRETGNQGNKTHLQWFNEKWSDGVDWREEFLLQVKSSKIAAKVPVPKPKPGEEGETEPLTPYELYIKLLHYKFGDLLDVDMTQAIGNYLPKNYKPLEYQLDAVKQCFGIMRTHGGFMLADVVGLGKTIVGTLIIKHFLNFPDDGRERKVLIVTPPAIKNAWIDTINEFDKKSDNQIAPFIDFITTGSIENLIESEDDDDADSGDFEGNLEYHNYGLIIIDESHKFRNSGTNMYNALDTLIAQIGGNTGNYPYIGLLSATPQNNTPNDLKNQIYLFERNHQYCTLEKVDGRNLEAFFAKIMERYTALRKEASAISAKEVKTIEDIKRLEEINKEIKELSVKIRDTVLCDILVRRTRTDLKKYYEEDMKTQKLVFPQISGPHSLEYVMDDELAQLFADTMDLISPSREFMFNNSEYLCYYRYRAIQFLKDEKNLEKYKGRGTRNPEKVGEQLAKIMQNLLVKRLESSFTAFTQSLINLRTYTKNMIKMWENDSIFICPQFNVNAELDEEAKSKKRDSKVTFNDCVEDIRARIKKLDEKGNNEKRQNAEYRREDFDAEYINLLKADYELIDKLCRRWATNSEDPKLDKFKESLKPVLFDPERNKKQKLVIFSEAIDTVNTLKRACEAKGFKGKVLVITAANRDECQQTIQENFDANYDESKQKNDYQIIITTEVLAEGINLHRANCILNYDTPWNSTRLMQRIGRVNRIGSTEPFVYVYNFMPSAQGDHQIQLVEKAHIKLQSFHTLFGEDSKIFTEKETVEHYDLNEIVNGEESAYEKYIFELKQYRDEHPERFEYISNVEDDLQMSAEGKDGNSYFVVRTPKMRGLFVRVDGEGNGKILTGLDFYPAFKSGVDEQRAEVPENWEQQSKTAIRTVGQHLAKMNTYKVKDAAATKAKGFIIKMTEEGKVSKDSKNLLNAAFKMINKGNSDIIRTINAIGNELMSDQGTLFPLTQEEIDEIITRSLDKIVTEQAQDNGMPEVYIGLAK